MNNPVEVSTIKACGYQIDLYRQASLSKRWIVCDPSLWMKVCHITGNLHLLWNFHVFSLIALLYNRRIGVRQFLLHELSDIINGRHLSDKKVYQRISIIMSYCHGRRKDLKGLSKSCKTSVLMLYHQTKSRKINHS